MSHKKEVILPNSAPSAGPYSGQLAIDPVTKQFVNGDITEQTRISLMNVKALVEAAGSSMDHIVKTTVYLADINEWPIMNEEYSKHFSKPAPARSAFQVAALPLGAKVEIEVIAAIPN
ncbi:RutC family protein [Zancudomyces culisetae]|uniref:RutC family protein n=1 Tax=Zancudomyces culisetae TaxID=1213189 RepID=A0A1R1PQJ6_ZANCU|nr:RutC family protein [Zancudomyces culisetae]OMH85587.1 RutC family protein [Zancudomyces culisetae]|eukprot:OMH83211.1 RutC family protein [Zancudomyces culisetae]